MVLLALIAIGLLSLSTVVIRSEGNLSAANEARANARLALFQALGQLQTHTGDDRRITANGDLLTEAIKPHALGVWESWSPNFTDDPASRNPDYESEKDSRFLRWLVSGRDDTSLEDLSWVTTADDSDTVALFREEEDGFELRGGKVELSNSKSLGEYAWAISQEGTKAKISVAGESKTLAHPNDVLQAQPRPNLTLSDVYQQAPDDDEWNLRAARVIDQRQVKLDEGIWQDDTSRRGGAHFTTHSFGLLTNAVEGGLKPDLSLGFEMPEEDFNADAWFTGNLSLPNPFHASAEKGFTTPANYMGQRPLYQPQGTSRSGTYRDNKLLGNFDTAKVQFEYPIYCAPTFTTLRSHYRTYHNVFNTDDGPTVFERSMDHVAGAPSRRLTRGFFPTPSLYSDAEKTQTALRPVMDRTIFIVSSYVTPDNRVAYMYTPVVTMWNPFNVALEIEGAVSYLWLDLPFLFSWDIYSRNNRVGGGSIHAADIGWQFDPNNPQHRGTPHGRSVDPYFYGAITATGAPLEKDSPNPTIRFQPGEVRLFVPASTERIKFVDSASIRNRTIFLKPYESPADLTNLEGGLYIPRGNPVTSSQSISMEFRSNRGDNYPFFVTLEDATRAKGSDPNHDDDRGHPIADIISRYFAQSGEGTTNRYSTPRVPVRSLKRKPHSFAVLESYHRVATPSSSTGSQTSDLVFTSNPRQPWMSDVISNRVTNFTSTSGSTGPQYQVRMKGLSGVFSNFLGGISGRNTFYGATNDVTGGRSHLSFFDVPINPMLSLGSFQHCDMSATTFSPANQFGNSWASAYVPRDKVLMTAGRSKPKMLDHCYLANEALWDGFFFSGAAPSVSPGSGGTDKDETIWDAPLSVETRSLKNVLTDFLDDPVTNPLRNSRMKLHLGNSNRDALLTELLGPQGSAIIAAHLLVDGSFNVNSTSIEAWRSILSSLRGAEYEMVDGRPAGGSDETPQSRFNNPVGDPNDNWHGFRTLTDQQITLLAENLVEEVRLRGPFLSLAEFVNRRISGNSDELGLKGAMQAAIDNSKLNENALQEPLDTASYSNKSKQNIIPADTGVGIPGYLTQADVLQSMAPILTARSDTFTIRAYGASKDPTGRVLADAWIEAVVQRVPEFVDPTNVAYTPIDDLSIINETFGRKYKIISFRYLAKGEKNA